MSKENDIELIRVPVDAGKYYGYDSPVIMRYQVQICVKKSDCIKNNILYSNTFAKVRISCFGNEERFPETPMLLRFREIRFASFPK